MSQPGMERQTHQLIHGSSVSTSFALVSFFSSFFAKSSNACLDGWEHNNLSTALNQSVGHVPSSQIRASLAYVEKYCPNEPYFFIA
jgi:hypothetical protein